MSQLNLTGNVDGVLVTTVKYVLQTIGESACAEASAGKHSSFLPTVKETGEDSDVGVKYISESFLT